MNPAAPVTTMASLVVCIHSEQLFYCCIVFVFPISYLSPLLSVYLYRGCSYNPKLFIRMRSHGFFESLNFAGTHTHHHPALCFTEPVTVFPDLIIRCHHIKAQVVFK